MRLPGFITVLLLAAAAAGAQIPAGELSFTDRRILEVTPVKDQASSGTRP